MTESVNADNAIHDTSEAAVVSEGATAPATGATVPDILHETGSAQASLLVGFQDFLGELADERKLPPEEDHPHLDPAVRQTLWLDRKLEKATERRKAIKSEYAKVTKGGHEALAERKEAIERELAPESPELMAQVALADDGRLSALAQAAMRAGSSGLPLAKVVLSEANARGLGEVSLLQSFPHLERPLREYQALPPSEVLARQADERIIEGLIPSVDPDRLRVRPYVKQGP
jgi:hypothetical protein